MSEIFIKVFNLSVTACIIVLAVLLLRFIFNKAPKWINCLLWGIVALRLIMPFSFESVLSLIPSAEPLPQNITVTDTPVINSGFEAVDDLVNPIISDSLAPSAGVSMTPMRSIIDFAAYVWVAGIALMLVWGVISYIRLYRRVRPSILFRDNIYYCDDIDTPFILGVVKPRIYIPSGMSEKEMQYVVEHEMAHLCRKDHFWKPLGFVLLSAYWFNPMIWIAYILLCRDIEKACDEKVIKNMDNGDKKGYSEALLSCSVHRRSIMACPLAFGEVGVKARIKAVLNYKKPAFWIIILAVVASIAVAVCFLTDPITQDEDTNIDVTAEQINKVKAKYPEYFGLDTFKGLEVYVFDISGGGYSYRLRSGTNRKPSIEEIEKLRGTTINEMRIILSSYDISADDIAVITKKSIDSSDYGVYDNDFTLHLRMALGLEKYSYIIPDRTYDSARFDIDGDGTDEDCYLGYGFTSGVFTFTIYACYTDTSITKYYDTVYSEWYDLSFVRSDDGVYRVQAITQDDKTHYFDISVEEGTVKLYENGELAGYYPSKIPITDITDIY